MKETEILDQARYILMTGKAIRDRVDQIILNHMQSHLLGLELSMAQMYALMMIRHRGRVSITELSEMLKVSAPSASTMVDRLVEKGILDRQPSRRDRRRMVVTIAPQVQKDFKGLESILLDSFADIVRKIGPEMTRQWCRVLESITEVID